MLRPRVIVAALAVFAAVACESRDSSRDTPSAGEWRALGTEPFWALDIESTGLRFRTPDDTVGIRWPPLTPVVEGDTMRLAGETERASVEVRIWPAQCSDGMSDRVWPYEAVVRVEGTTYRGCAESRAGLPHPAAQPPL